MASAPEEEPGLEKCPCSKLVSLDPIMKALTIEIRCGELLDWFSCEEASSCSKLGDCRVRRVIASFSILNGIRVACKPYLESSRSGGDRQKCKNSTDPPSAVKVLPEQKYEDQFPSLGTTRSQNNNAATTNPSAQHNGKNAGKKKKRIRPVAAVAPSGATSGVWGEIAKQPPQQATRIPTTLHQNKQPANLETSSWGNRPTNLHDKSLGVGRQLRKKQTQPAETTHLEKEKGAALPKSPTRNEASTAPPCILGKGDAQKTVGFSTPLSTEEPRQPTPSNVAFTNDAGMMDRLVKVYCSLILHGMVPSTAMEFHLLLRLLHVTESTESLVSNEGTEINPRLASLFAGASRCRSFAIKALTSLSPQLKIFPVPFLQDLVKSQAFRSHLPELTLELEGCIRKRMMSNHGSAPLIMNEQTNLFADSGPVLTLPFHAPRDSRHNYKTREEVAMYKNREESRDAFLYQLRSFLNVKGKVVDTVQAQKAMYRIQNSFRVILDGIIGANIPWFAQFVGELLLQIGLTPVEETDKELLSIAGNEKLQKLHKRFSSRVGGTHSKKWKLASEKSNRRNNSILPPHEQAKEYFPGYQEFFYLFIISIDSYKFNSHLRNQFVHLIKKNLQTADNHPSTSLEKKLMHMQMLARFLGVLVFSPCWQEADGNTNIYTEGAPPDGLQQLDSDPGSGLSLTTMVRQSEAEGNLTLVVPWVVELLKMALWDESLQSRSTTYRMLLLLLRQIQERLRASLYDGTKPTGNTLTFQLVIWCLDAFFGEHLGLTTSASLAPSFDCAVASSCGKMETSHPASDAETLDDCPLVFCTSTLVAVNPHLEELFSLATALSKADHHRLFARSPGFSRKLRPHMVSSGVTLQKQGKGPEIETTHSMKTTKANGSGLSRLQPHGVNSLEAKMVDVFFHQHQELKEICEFSVHRILTHVMNALPQQMAKRGDDKDENILKASQNFLRTKLQEGVGQALCLLEPRNTHQKVHEVALSLAVARGYETGLPHLGNLVATEFKSVRRSLFQEGTQDGSTSGKTNKQSAQTLQEAQLCTLTEVINQLSAGIAGGMRVDKSGQVLECLQALEPLVESWAASSNPQIPPEKMLRSYFESIAQLDRQSATFVRSCVGDERSNGIDSTKRWMALAAFLRIASQLSSHPRHGLSRVRKYMGCVEALQECIKFGLATGSTSEVSKVLIALMDSDLLAEQHLYEVPVLAGSEADNCQMRELITQCTLMLKQRDVRALTDLSETVTAR